MHAGIEQRPNFRLASPLLYFIYNANSTSTPTPHFFKYAMVIEGPFISSTCYVMLACLRVRGSSESSKLYI
ncbi:hypothetical protein EYC80_007206 [Monilinia laxa]|uniref:Uncharacterized protein n=1 Tax=Monilinia laxa TaxID=61186 RepID=A0A5N6K0W4_MONLA|nr:hypothetical protein EYC80_007206 [Monilinia laxa]